MHIDHLKWVKERGENKTIVEFNIPVAVNVHIKRN